MASRIPERTTVLQKLQRELESIYRFESQLVVSDFIIDRERWRAHSEADTAEELLVIENDGEVEVGLFLDEAVIDVLARDDGDWTHQRLQAHCRAVEGVSHFLYVTQRAVVPRPVSQLELELQAEIDKFATVVLRLWEAGQRHAASLLRSLLFEQVSFREDLSEAQRSRYERANWLASTYCRFLERRYIAHNSIEGFLADLRRIYRLGAGEKLSYAAAGNAP